MSFSMKTTISKPVRYKNYLDIAKHKLKNIEIEVGIFENKYVAPNLTLFDLAQIHEYGTATIPERPFLRTMFTDKRRYMPTIDSQLKKYMSFNITMKEMSENIGKKFVEQTKKTIDKHIPPPLQPATVEQKQRKGYSQPFKPLYATGLLYNSIDFRTKRTK
jgi:hypothetical protein